LLWQALNPFSKKAIEVLEKHPRVGDFSSEVFELAERKVAWKGASKRPPITLLKPPATRKELELDVLSYYILFLTGGASFSLYSNEVRLIKDIVRELTYHRLKELKEEGLALPSITERIATVKITEELGGLGKTLIDPGFSKEEWTKLGKPDYVINSWRSLTPLLRAKEAKLTDWYIVKGRIPLTFEELLIYYSKLVSIGAFEYMINIYERPPPLDGETQVRIKHIADLLTEVSSTHYRSVMKTGMAKSLNPESFPPCIANTLAGVSSGSRNYAISVLLTSFLSYARLAPEKVENPRIVDFTKDPKVVTEEILPLIEQAAERCSPPLFEDQPLERMNVTYHLGFGLGGDVRLEASGTSKWYFPPNCEKIQREAPALCKPDSSCAKIKNPLTYYFVKEAGGE